MQMEQFSWLLVGHLIGDYLLQTRWMAEKKGQKWLPLLVHSLVYTLVVSGLALLAKGLSIGAIAMIFLSHVFLDRRRFINFWAEKINGTGNIDWLKVMLDQSWHIIILAIATVI
jgi:hypothetical protein